ncbi:MAG: hypothetical protein HYR62_08690 [Actinobacteria bacterium]|nr:hypothetical protein [Actinomycetota bacterium]MBI3687490.1 hypothetical protein [Actinomycetota bacterium]
MVGRSDPRRASQSRGRLVTLGVGALLAIAATGALILTDNLRVLRLAVVVALWAFVVATMASIRRNPAADEPAPSRELELRREYQVELDREVAARREHESRIEADLRREAQDGLHRQVEELRHEVQGLRKDIVDRLDGELRLERIAWHAESTRLTGTPPGLRGFRADDRPHAAGVPSVIGEPASPRAELSPPAERWESSPRPTMDDYAAPRLPHPVAGPSGPWAGSAPAEHEPARARRGPPPPASSGRQAAPPAPPPPHRAEPPYRAEPPRHPDPLSDPLPPGSVSSGVPFDRTRFGSDTGEFAVQPEGAAPARPAPPRHPDEPSYRDMPGRSERADRSERSGRHVARHDERDQGRPGEPRGGRHSQPPAPDPYDTAPQQPRRRRYRDDGEDDERPRSVRER